MFDVQIDTFFRIILLSILAGKKLMAELQDLPSEILERIFDLLDFRDRIRLERVCRIWRQLCLTNGWTGVRQLKFTWEMLGLEEPWKPFMAKEMERFRYKKISAQELRQILQNPAIYKKKRPSRTLGVLNAYLRRCGHHLVEFHLGRGICCNTRFGRSMPMLSSKLAHLRIEEPLDEWHFRQIECHLAPQLLSISAHPYEKKKSHKSRLAFASLLSKCERLECLRVNYLDTCFWPEEDGQPVVPATLKYLHNFNSFYYYEGHQQWDECVKCVRTLLDKCPQMHFFLPFLTCNVHEEQLSIDSQLLNLQWPLLFIQSKIFPDLRLHTRIGALRALKLHNEYISGADLDQITKYCPQLEHFDLKKCFIVEHLHGFVSLREFMEPLYALRHLSSLGIQIEMRERSIVNEQLNFHYMECNGGERMDDVMMEILSHLDTINPLKSIEFHYEHYQNLQLPKEYICRLAQQLPHLEFFFCCLDVYGCQDLPEATISKLNSILGEGHEQRKLANFHFRHYDSCQCGEEIILNWQRGNKANLQQQKQKPPTYGYWDFWAGRSPVLHRILDAELGPARTHILFGYS